MNFYLLKQTIYATIFTWGVSTLGALLCFIIKKENRKLMIVFTGLGAGVMLASSFFSLINPGLEIAEKLNQKGYISVGFGFLVGAAFLYIIDKIVSIIENKNKIPKDEKFKNKFLLILAITMHNIPEGLAIGVLFGSISSNIDSKMLLEAWMLAIGIGIQNFPEGLAVSMPLVTSGMSKKKSFLYGSLSGIVEPIGGIIGVILATFINCILPFVLGFASGAMIYVVVEELIPEGKVDKSSKLGTIGVIFGFLIMMILDVWLG